MSELAGWHAVKTQVLTSDDGEDGADVADCKKGADDADSADGADGADDAESANRADVADGSELLSGEGGCETASDELWIDDKSPN